MNSARSSGPAAQALHRSLVVIEQNRLLYGTQPLTLSVNIGIACALALALSSAIGRELLWSWLLGMGLVQGARLLLYLGFCRDQARAEAERRSTPDLWLRRFRAGATASGLAWGMAGLALFPESQDAQHFLAITLTAVSAASISSLATDRISLLGFAMPVVLPFASRLLLSGGMMQQIMAGMVTVFALYVLGSSRRLQRQLEDNVQLRALGIEREVALLDEQKLNAIIARVQLQFIRESERSQAFELMLEDMLTLTGSEYGFIADVLRDAEGAPYLKSRALTNIAWNEQTRAFYEAQASQGLEFRKLRSLYGAALLSGEPLIANHPAADARSGGLPDGHPPLNAFMGVPIRHRGEMVAMIGLANRPGGYDRALLDFLHPLLVTLGQLMDAARAEQKYRAHQVELARLSAVASQTTNAVVITDPQGRVEWVNAGFTRMSGYTLEELQGRRPGEVLQGPETDTAAVARMQAALAQEQPFQLELLNYGKDGRSYWIEISCNPLRDERGVLQGFMAIQSDITLRKADAERLRSTTLLLDSILENVPATIFLKRASDLRYEFINRAGEELLGRSRAQLLERGADELMPLDEARALEAQERELLARPGALSVLREQLRTPSGLRVLYTQKLALSDASGQPRYLLGISEDITERQRAEQIKDEFISTVSHELRTPLTVIAGSLDLLLGGVLERRPERAREMLTVAHSNSQRLTLLINDLLDMEKLAAGKVSFDLVAQDLRPLLHQAVLENQNYAEQHQTQLLLDELPDEAAMVAVDAQRLQQVLANLLSNAAKFSPPGVPVQVRLLRPQPQTWRVEVQDRGPGIPDAFRGRVFEKFAQADASSTRSKQGTGLGLAISRELMLGMNGHIGFESQAGQGSCFYIELPSQPEAARA